MRAAFLPYNYVHLMYHKLKYLHQGSKTIDEYTSEFYYQKLLVRFQRSNGYLIYQGLTTKYSKTLLTYLLMIDTHEETMGTNKDIHDENERNDDNLEEDEYVRGVV